MLRSARSMAAAVLLCASATAQRNDKASLLPITAPIKHAGVYHVATGTWTRGATIANGTGPKVIYDNSCAVVYFTGMLSTERFQHRGRIPSPSGPTTDSLFYGTAQSDHRYDERPGCQIRYTINGFETAYCTSHTGKIDW